MDAAGEGEEVEMKRKFDTTTDTAEETKLATTETEVNSDEEISSEYDSESLDSHFNDLYPPSKVTLPVKYMACPDQALAIELRCLVDTEYDNDFKAQIDGDDFLSDALVKLQAGNLSKDLLENDKDLMSCVLTIERGLENRIETAIRWYRYTKHLVKKGLIPEYEVDVMNEATVNLEKAIDLVEAIDTRAKITDLAIKGKEALTNETPESWLTDELNEIGKVAEDVNINQMEIDDEEVLYPEAVCLGPRLSEGCNLTVEEIVNRFVRCGEKEHDDEFKMQIDTDSALGDVLEKLQNFEITEKIYQGDRKIQSQVKTLERGLKNRLYFALRQYRDLSLLNKWIDESVISKARKELSKAIDLLESVNTEMTVDMAGRAKAELSGTAEHEENSLNITTISDLHIGKHENGDTRHFMMNVDLSRLSGLDEVSEMTKAKGTRSSSDEDKVSERMDSLSGRDQEYVVSQEGSSSDEDEIGAKDTKMVSQQQKKPRHS